MARNGSDDNQNYYSDDEPTRRSDYQGAGYPEYADEPVPEAAPWYRRPLVLVAVGAVGALLIALVVYGLAQVIAGDSTSDPATTTRLTPLTTSTSTSAPAVVPPATVTQTVPPETTVEPTATEPTTTTTTPTTTTTAEPTTTVSTSTVTQTETATETVTESPDSAQP